MRDYCVEVRVKEFDLGLMEGLVVLANSFEAIKTSVGYSESVGPNVSAKFNDKKNACGFMEHIGDLDYVRDVLYVPRR